jgi:hypothetical protein
MLRGVDPIFPLSLDSSGDYCFCYTPSTLRGSVTSVSSKVIISLISSLVLSAHDPLKFYIHHVGPAGEGPAPIARTFP